MPKHRYTWYLGKADSKSGVKFLKVLALNPFFCKFGPKKYSETLLLFLDIQLVLVLDFKIALIHTYIYICIYIYIYIYQNIKGIKTLHLISQL